MLQNTLTKILLLSGLCFLCLSCSSMQESGYDNNSADSGFQKAPVSQATSEEHLGIDYLLGRGVAENDRLAFDWLQKAADQGSMTAANELGFMYASGKGVEQNYSLAIEWYEKAADSGIASAKYNLGMIYALGLGTPADPAQAEQYFSEAAALGFTPAQARSPGPMAAAKNAAKIDI